MAISGGGQLRITFLVIFTVATLLFQKWNFCGSFITLEVSKLQITFNSFLQTRCGSQKDLQLKHRAVYQCATCLC